MRIAVGFDGTIVENEYPEIGAEREGAVSTLKKLISEGNKVILWTSRSGVYLEEAINWCSEKELVFYAVNADQPKSSSSRKSDSPKISADVFIDARNLGGIPGWDEIYDMVNEQRSAYHKSQSHGSRRRRRNRNSSLKLWERLVLHIKA